MTGLVFHGLRKTANAMLADVGRTDADIMDITGHRTCETVTLCTCGSERKQRAASAIKNLESRSKLPNTSHKSA